MFNDATSCWDYFISCDLRSCFIIIIFTREWINLRFYDTDGRLMKYECGVGMDWYLEGNPEILHDKATLSTTDRTYVALCFNSLLRAERNCYL